MDFNPQKVNEGRFLSAMSLEDRVLENGILPSSPLLERASLVKGILTGLLEQGKWQYALKLVYGDGPVRGLFDGDWDGFRGQVLHSMKNSKQPWLQESTIPLLIKNGEAELLYTLATTMDLGKSEEDSEKSLPRIVRFLKEKSPHYHVQLCNDLADKAEKEERWFDAASWYESAGNKEAADKVYEQILEKPLENWSTALLLLTRFPDRKEVFPNRTEKLTELVKAVLQDPERLKSRDVVAELSRVVQNNSVYLSDEERDTLGRANAIHSYRFDNLKTPEHRLLWAKTHFEHDPRSAYSLFVQHNYDGPEVLDAVKAGLEREWRPHDNQKLSLDSVKPEHLLAVYEQVSLSTKAGIASHLKDSEKLKELSRQYAQEGNLRFSYNLWIEGQADLEDRFFTDVRERLIAEEVESSYVSFSFLNKADTKGYQRVIDLVFEQKPFQAYGLAHAVQDEERLQRTREQLIRVAPERALQQFQEKNDVVGKNAALDALARKYEIPRAQMEFYIGLHKKKPE